MYLRHIDSAIVVNLITRALFKLIRFHLTCLITLTTCTSEFLFCFVLLYFFQATTIMRQPGADSAVIHVHYLITSYVNVSLVIKIAMDEI